MGRVRVDLKGKEKLNKAELEAFSAFSAALKRKVALLEDVLGFLKGTSFGFEEALKEQKQKKGRNK